MMTRAKRATAILVVEDDATTAGLIKLYLEHEGYKVTTAADGGEGLAAALRDMPALVVLDVMLPSLDGMELCRRLRAASDAPVIMLTAKSTESDKVEGFASGADDYVVKPFSPRELVARVEAVLRRGGQRGPARRRRFEFKSLVLDAAAREVTVDGRQTQLTPTEFDILQVFCRQPGAVLTRADLVERALGHDYDGTERSVDAHVAKLRKKLGTAADGSEFIATIFGVGYKFVARMPDA
jgi:DNA-binding response OmpR family regulator